MSSGIAGKRRLGRDAKMRSPARVEESKFSGRLRCDAFQNLFWPLRWHLLASPLFAQISVPEIPFDSAPNLLKMPDNIVMGEAVGVATNSKGHIFVYTRDGILAYSVGSSRQFGRGAAARLYEFDEKGNFMREIGKGTYAQAFAHTVRVDPQDNIWMVDEGSNMIVKFSPEGKVLMTLGRKPEDFAGIPGPVEENQSSGGRSGGSIETQLLLSSRPGGMPPAAAAAGGGGEGFGLGPFAMFNRETDVAWDAAGNIFVSDGYNNKRVVKFDKNGKFLKAVRLARARPGPIRGRAHDPGRSPGQRVRRRPRQQAALGLRQRRKLSRPATSTSDLPGRFASLQANTSIFTAQIPPARRTWKTTAKFTRWSSTAASSASSAKAASK